MLAVTPIDLADWRHCVQSWCRLTVKQFIKHYKLDSTGHTDALLYVTTLDPLGQRGVAAKEQQLELVQRYRSLCVLCHAGNCGKFA